jgi:uncharacterized membrane protein
MNKDTKNLVIIVVSVACILVFFVFAAATKAILLPEIPASFLGAAAGAVITAVVTLLLLQGQTRAEELKERNVAVFKDKSEVFKKFIGNLWNAWDDHKIDRKEYYTLTSSFYKELMLYLNAKSQQTIGNALLGISDCIDVAADVGSVVDKKLREFIVVVMNTLIEELSLGGSIDAELFKNIERKMDEAEQQSLDQPAGEIIDVAGRVRSPRTTFKMLGVKKGAKLVFKDNPSITCITEDETNKVLFEGKVRTISNVSDELMKRPSNGFACFTIDGATLWDMRQKLEAEGTESAG